MDMKSSFSTTKEGKGRRDKEKKMVGALFFIFKESGAKNAKVVITIMIFLVESYNECICCGHTLCGVCVSHSKLVSYAINKTNLLTHKI